MGKREGGRKPRGKTVKDVKRGSAANGYRVPVGGDEEFDGNNETFEPSGKALADAVEAIMTERATIKSIMDAARKKCQAPRAAITKTTKRMVKDGYQAKVFGALIRDKVLEQKIEQNKHNLAPDEGASFAAFKLAMAGTPLGDAAIQHAEAAMRARGESAEPVH
jgi:hypothetical protein